MKKIIMTLMNLFVVTGLILPNTVSCEPEKIPVDDLIDIHDFGFIPNPNFEIIGQLIIKLNPRIESNDFDFVIKSNFILVEGRSESLIVKSGSLAIINYQSKITFGSPGNLDSNCIFRKKGDKCFTFISILDKTFDPQKNENKISIKNNWDQTISAQWSIAENKDYLLVTCTCSFFHQSYQDKITSISISIPNIHIANINIYHSN
ncbi:hypothetical protein [Spiroplasma alleghenense]|uniref:Uncharacterized protein n=1 Tax=Spiroplasma alleghenense TaxID=216931 RepID=A0A345Z4I2_9MOLU|nr:hypothetical protein [Spiroplasma alleghenense]AXK51511.1 hypothetical protein SALLE_v1c08410 [Spiroplasma alleghenense]